MTISPPRCNIPKIGGFSWASVPRPRSPFRRRRRPARPFFASSAESVGGKNATRSAFPRLFSGIRLRRRPSFVVPEIEAWKRRLFAYELGLPLLSSQSRACSLIFHPQILQKSPKTSHAPPPWGGILCRKKRDFSLN